MLAEERLAAIVAAVEQRGAATVAQLCEATGADAVQCIGSKFVLYRQSSDEDKRKIVLVK